MASPFCKGYHFEPCPTPVCIHLGQNGGPVKRGCVAALRTAVISLGIGACVAAHAIPTSLSKVQFTAQIAGLTTVIEDFEGYPNGTDFLSPFVTLNGTFTSSAPRVQASATLCGDVDQCLFDSSSADGPRTFQMFPLGTQFWGSDVSLVDTTDTLKLTVTGGSGVLSFETAGISFAGFEDPLGLMSVEFENLGTDSGNGNTGFGNYSFDNVTTASPAAIPEPGTLALLGIAVAGIAVRTRRRGRPQR
jgi:hypothetical protein